MATLARSEALTSPGHQAFQILHVGFTILPILAGLDKFLHILVDWHMYLSPIVPAVLPVSPQGFMSFVGLIEIAAGSLVALRPHIGGYVVAFWLWGVIFNLLLVPGYYDIALRDFGLSLGALALARLALTYGRKRVAA